MECLEAEHWSRDPLDETMVLLDHVVDVFRLDNLDDFTGIRELENDVEALQAGQIGTAFVDGNPVRHTVGANGASEEASSCCGIPTLRQHEIKDLAVTIDGAVVIHPFPANLDIGFVHPPGNRCRLLSRVGVHCNQWREFNDPAVQCRMVDIDIDALPLFPQDRGITRRSGHRKTPHTRSRFWG
jgi:hypothetical protein